MNDLLRAAAEYAAAARELDEAKQAELDSNHHVDATRRVWAAYDRCFPAQQALLKAAKEAM